MSTLFGYFNNEWTTHSAWSSLVGLGDLQLARFTCSATGERSAVLPASARWSLATPKSKPSGLWSNCGRQGRWIVHPPVIHSTNQAPTSLGIPPAGVTHLAGRVLFPDWISFSLSSGGVCGKWANGRMHCVPPAFFCQLARQPICKSACC